MNCQFWNKESLKSSISIKKLMVALIISVINEFLKKSFFQIKAFE